jgi:uncharacterized protein YuzE
MAMSEPVFNYEEASDTLYLSFTPAEAATGIELNEHILLRINKQERRAIGITFFEYSVLTQRTEVGPRSLPLTGLAELSEDLRGMVLEVLLHPPVSQVLRLSAYTPSASETIPVASLEPASTTG